MLVDSIWFYPVMGLVCFLAIYLFPRFLNLLKIRGLRSADDKQRPSGDMIRKHLCIPCSVALEPWSIGDIGILDINQLANGPGVK